MKCARVDCGREIVGRRSNARYCSPHCKHLTNARDAYARHRWAINVRRRLKRTPRKGRKRSPDTRDRRTRYALNRAAQIARAKAYYRQLRSKALAYDRIMSMMEGSHGRIRNTIS